MSDLVNGKASHAYVRYGKQYDLSKCTDTVSEPAALLLAKIVKNTKKLQFNVLKRAFKIVRSNNTNSQILHWVNKLQISTTKYQWFAHRVKTRTNPVAGPPLLNGRCTSLLRAPRLWNDLYCVEWDVKLYYTIPSYSDCRLCTCREVVGPTPV